MRTLSQINAAAMDMEETFRWISVGLLCLMFEKAFEIVTVMASNEARPGIGCPLIIERKHRAAHKSSLPQRSMMSDRTAGFFDRNATDEAANMEIPDAADIAAVCPGLA